ncbi:hypothetical protein ACHWQZ_G009800 [Mnemiopsis leidyi]
MSSKFILPADFGRHHIGAPSHNNLTINLGKGDKIGANSVIMALNSPVIADMTTTGQLTSIEASDFSREAVNCFVEALYTGNLKAVNGSNATEVIEMGRVFQSSLEADDFCKEAVECFIESSYTGDIEALNLENFRDFNKMSRVFEVNWLVAKCKQYFVSYLDNLRNGSSYLDMMFAVEEAVYLKSAMKNESFLNLVLKKMLSFPVSKRRDFIKNYLSDLNKSSAYKIDACIAMVKSNVHILAELLIAHLRQSGNISLDRNSRHLLRNLDMTMCFFKKRELHAEIFGVLENLTEVTNEDVKLFVHLHKQSTSKACVPFVPVIQRGSFERFLKECCSIDDILDELATRKDVTDLYSLIDGLWLRLYNVKEKSIKSYYEFVEKITNVAKQRGWSTIDRKYAEALIHHSYTQDFLHAILACDDLVSKDSNAQFVKVFEYSRSRFGSTLFLQDNIFKFQIPGEFYLGLTFVLLTSSVESSPDCFDLRWGLFDAPPGCNVTCLPMLHFFLVELDDEGEWKCILPITWCGQPTCDDTDGLWNWGYVKLHQKNKGNMIKLVGNAKGYVDWRCYHRVGVNSRLRMVVFEV